MKTRTLNNVCLLLLVMVAAAGGGCSSMGPQRDTTHDAINQELDNAVNNRVKPATPEAVNQALLPPLRMEMPQAQGKPIEGALRSEREQRAGEPGVHVHRIGHALQHAGAPGRERKPSRSISRTSPCPRRWTRFANSMATNTR